MDSSASRPGDEELTRQVRWVQRLAYALLRDWQLAEDVSQEVLLRALQGAPGHGRVRRAWLAAVTKNLSQNLLRDRLRLAARERKAAQSGEVWPAKTPLEVLESLRALTRAMGSLTPEQREVVVLRFFDDLSFEAIAARLNVSQGAAHMRLHRALAALRRELSSHGQNWSALCAQALPASMGPFLGGIATMGGTLMSQSTYIKLAGIAAALLILLTTVFFLLQDPEEISAIPPDPGFLALAEKGAEDDAPTVPAITREIVAASAAARQLPAGLLLRPAPVMGRVYHQSAPVAGALVTADQAGIRHSTQSDESGMFRLDLDPYALVSVYAEKGSLRGAGNSVADWGFPLWPMRVDLMPSQAGFSQVFVRDADGTPVGGARIRVYQHPYSGNDSDAVLPRATRCPLLGEGFTDREGRFAWEPHPSAGALLFEVVAAGFYSSWTSEDWNEDSPTVELRSGADPDVILIGSTGEPIAGALVRLGDRAYREAITDSDGRIPGPLGWNQGLETDRLPFFLVRLPSGLWWRSDAVASLRFEAFSLRAGEIILMITEQVVQAKLEHSILPRGSWVEAARAMNDIPGPRYGAQYKDPDILDNELQLNLPWQRLHPDTWVTLDRGLTGPEPCVIARLQPQQLVFGAFSVEAGQATVRLPSLARVVAEVDGLPDPESRNWKLLLVNLEITKQQGTLLDRDEALDHGQSGRFERYALPGRYIVVLEHASTLASYYWSGSEWCAGRIDRESNAGTQLPAGDTVLRGRLDPAAWMRVQVRVDGHPVEGGIIGSSRIDSEGWTLMLRDHDARSPTLRCNLWIPSAVGNGSDSPVSGVCILVASLAPIESVLNVRLTTVLLDPNAIDATQQYTLKFEALDENGAKIGSEWTFHDARDRQGSNMGRLIGIGPSTRDWKFRLPAGTYRFELDPVFEGPTIALGAREGVRLLPGTQTVLSKQD